MTQVKDLRYEKAPQRRERVIALIRREGFATTGWLAQEFGVSEMTVRRDLQRLEQGGEIRVVPGGVSLRSPAGGTDFRLRLITEEAEKRAIGATASRMVERGSIVGIDAGSTALEVLRQLPPDLDLTVVTQSLPAMNEAATRRDLKLMALGGIFRPEAGSFFGPGTVASVDQVHIDIAFIGATAIRDGEAFCGNPYDAETKRAMHQSAAKSVLVVDSRKFERTAMMRIVSLSAFDAIAIDEGVSAENTQFLESLGIDLRIARLHEDSASA